MCQSPPVNTVRVDTIHMNAGGKQCTHLWVCVCCYCSCTFINTVVYSVFIVFFFPFCSESETCSVFRHLMNAAIWLNVFLGVGQSGGSVMMMVWRILCGQAGMPAERETLDDSGALQSWTGALEDARDQRAACHRQAVVRSAKSSALLLGWTPTLPGPHSPHASPFITVYGLSGLSSRHRFSSWVLSSPKSSRWVRFRSEDQVLSWLNALINVLILCFTS